MSYDTDIVDLYRRASADEVPAAIKELARLSTKAKSETARIAAARELLDRGYGRPRVMGEALALDMPDVRAAADVCGALGTITGHLCESPPAQALRTTSSSPASPTAVAKRSPPHIVSKRKDSPYRSGRSPHWIKSKNPTAPVDQ